MTNTTVKNNVMYEDDDIDYGILDKECDLDEFINEAKELVTERKSYECVNRKYNQKKSTDNYYDYYSGKGTGDSPEDIVDDFYEAYSDYFDK